MLMIHLPQTSIQCLVKRGGGGGGEGTYLIKGSWSREEPSPSSLFNKVNILILVVIIDQ